MISVSGSALVFRNELYTVLWPGPKMVTVSGTTPDSRPNCEQPRAGPTPAIQ